jgi:hypothetical protein
MPSIYLFNTGWLSVFVQENDMSYLLQYISSCSLSVDVMVEWYITDWDYDVREIYFLAVFSLRCKWHIYTYIINLTVHVGNGTPVIGHNEDITDVNNLLFYNLLRCP